MAHVQASSVSEILTSQSFESQVPIEPRSSFESEIHESAASEESLQWTPSLSPPYSYPSRYRFRTKNSEEFVEELIKKKRAKEAIKKPELVPMLEPKEPEKPMPPPVVPPPLPMLIPKQRKKKPEKKDKGKKEEEGYKDYAKYETLRRAAVDEDWHVVKNFIEDHPEALTAELLDSSETILHYVVRSENIIEFVRWLVAEMPEEALEHTDMWNMTALSYCAAYGNAEAAEIMVRKNHKLLNIQDGWGNLPLHLAARFGKKDMVSSWLKIW